MRDTSDTIVQFEFGEDGTSPVQVSSNEEVDIDVEHVADRILNSEFDSDTQKAEFLRSRSRRRTSPSTAPPGRWNRMTEFDVTDGVHDVIEDTELPRRLKDEVLATAEERGVTKSQANEIATAVEAQYLDTRVDPLDPVGTVSAQSIGEPGTQMTMNTFHYAGVVRWT